MNNPTEKVKRIAVKDTVQFSFLIEANDNQEQLFDELLETISEYFSIPANEIQWKVSEFTKTHKPVLAISYKNRCGALAVSNQLIYGSEWNATSVTINIPKDEYDRYQIIG